MAARDLFLAQGFEGVTMDLVAARAGVSKATVYAYHASKEELFSAALEEEFARINGAILAPFERLWASEESIETVLAEIAQTFIGVFLCERTVAMQRAIYGALPRFQDVAKLVFGSGPSELIQRLAEMLASAHRLGKLDVPDPNLAARQFIRLTRDQYDLMGLLMLPKPSQAEIDSSVAGTIDLFMARYRPPAQNPRSRQI